MCLFLILEDRSASSDYLCKKIAKSVKHRSPDMSSGLVAGFVWPRGKNLNIYIIFYTDIKNEKEHRLFWEAGGRASAGLLLNLTLSYG